MSATAYAWAPPIAPPKPWRRALGACVLAWLGLLLLYGPTAASMPAIWSRSDTYAHGYLVLPLVLWLVWRQRGALASLQPAPDLRLLPWLLLPGVLWLLGQLALVHAMAQAALVGFAVLAVPLLLGRRVGRRLRFALLFLFFAVPVGEFLMPTFMDWTANVTIFALRASGIPVYREGNSFGIPGGRWSVVEACSGVRYLIASFMVGTLFAHLSFRSARRRWLFMGVSLLVPIVANWARAFMVVLLGYWSNNRIATGVDHVLYGWLFFGVVILLMLALGGRYADAPAPALRPAPSPPPSVLGHRRVALWPPLLGLALLAAWPPVLRERLQGPPVPNLAAPAHRNLAAPALGPDWPQLEGQMPWEPAYGEDAQTLQAHYGQAPAVGLYVARYAQQGWGHTLVGAGHALLPSEGGAWLLAGQGRQSVRLGSATLTLATSTLHANALQGASPQASLLVSQLYWVHGHVSANPAMAKAWGAWARLQGQPDDAAVLLAYTDAGTDASRTLERFWRDNFSALDAWLRRGATPPTPTESAP